MKIEFTHDIIAQKVWERLPEEERQLKLVAGSLKQRLEDFHKGNGSLLGIKELVAWERYFPLLATEGPLKKFIEDSHKEVQAQEEKEKLINQRLRSRLRLIYIIAGAMLLLAVFFFFQARTISNQKNRIETDALKAAQLRLAFGADDRTYFIEEGIKKFKNAEFQESIYDFAIARFLNKDGDTTLVSSWINRAQQGLEAQALFQAGKWLEVDRIIQEISDTQNEPIALINRLEEARIAWDPIINAADKAERTQIDLSGMNLHAIPEEISQMLNLEQLYLSKNHLKELPATLAQLKKLRELDLSGNELEEVSSNIGELTALEVLYLSENKINTLPASIGQLSQLEVFEINHNEMDSLPREISQLKALNRLLANNNHLDSLPQGFGTFPNLTNIDLDSNRLQALPEGFGNMPQLKQLKISNNQLTALPTSCDQLQKLTVFHAEHNQLKGFPVFLEALQNIESIYLQNNQINEVTEAFLDNVPGRLFFLGLKGNPISEDGLNSITQKLNGISVE